MKQSKEFTVDRLTVKILHNRNEMGVSAADDVACRIKELLTRENDVNIIFAAAPSQNEFLNALAVEPGINWKRVNAFHMDEYIGLEQNHPQRFGNFLKERIFGKVAFRKIYYLSANDQTPEIICKNYAELLRTFPPDIVCMGIGENAHVAFNDPHVANFNDPAPVKLVYLDEISRQQQVHDGCFTTIDEVPETAITLTIPTLMGARFIYCIVPGKNKADAIYHTINEGICEQYPSTSLREHPNAILYLDKESAAKLSKEGKYAEK